MASFLFRKKTTGFSRRVRLTVTVDNMRVIFMLKYNYAPDYHSHRHSYHLCSQRGVGRTNSQYVV